MNKLISEGIEVAGEVADKIKESQSQNKNKNSSGGFPYKTVLLAVGVVALIGYMINNADTSKKKA